MADPRPTHTRPAEDPEPPGDRGAQKGQRSATVILVVAAALVIAAIVVGWAVFGSNA